jgi:hypothetical protein
MMKDFYALAGVFAGTEYQEYPLAPANVVADYKQHQRKMKDQEVAIKNFIDVQSKQFAEILVHQTSAYIQAGWKVLGPQKLSAQKATCGGCDVPVKAMSRDKAALWTDLFAPKRLTLDNITYTPDGVLYYGDGKIDRFLSGAWKGYLASMRSRLETLKRSSPPIYPYVHVISDLAKPDNLRVHLRGSPYNLGDEVPRRFLSVLSASEPVPFSRGSGRLDLAEAVANHPLAARVIANRIWKYHFGRGIVGTPSNFGQMGERPSHPELLECLASKLTETNWSIKALHREIMLSATYQLSSSYSKENFAIDPDNRLLWRANRHRLDLEALRDSLLAVSGSLNPSVGGPSFEWTEEDNRRTIYGKVSRARLNPLLPLFDFPDPGSSSEQRSVTNVPLQRLFFMNSEFVARQADILAQRLSSDRNADDKAKIQKAYQLLYGRDVTEAEAQLGLEFLDKGDSAWSQYLQALLSTNEFIFVN